MSISRQLDRVPPQNLEAEQSVLGSMLLDRDAIARAVEKLRPEDFYRDAHRVIFTAMLDLFERGEPVDLITVTNRLAGMGKLDDVGGATYLASLPNTVPTAANVDYYAGIVLEKSMLRALIGAGTHIASLGYEGADDVAVLIDQAEKLVFGIAARRNLQDFQAIKEILKESFEKIDKRYQEKGTLTGIATGFADFDKLTSGLQPSDMVVVAARPSVGKCLSYDSEIVSEDGRVVTIEDFYRRREGSLFTLGSDLKFHKATPADFVDDGQKPVFRVTTRLGRVIECTAAHPFLTMQGWQALSSLAAGERVAVPRKLEVFGNRPQRDCEVVLLAYLTGDGTLTRGIAAFTNTDPHLVGDFISAVKAFGGVRARRQQNGDRAPTFFIHGDPQFIALHRRDFARRLGDELGRVRGAPARLARLAGVDPHGLPAINRSSKNPLVLWLMEHGLSGKASREKTIPSAIFALPRKQVALFLNRLFATDGWASISAATKLAQIGYASTSERLVRQIQHLLLRFGIVASVRSKKVMYRDHRRSAWHLEVTDPPSILRFAQDIGIFGKDAHVQRVLDIIAARERRPNRDLQLLARAVGDESVQRLADSEIYWDEIMSIEPAGVKQVYDLTIPDTHNFVANDICVHNTAFSTNIAQHAALAHKIPVAIFSLETSKEQLVQRILCSEAQVDNTKLRTGFLADEDWRRLARAMGGLSEAPIFIDDSPNLSVIEMRAKARKLKAEHGLGLIVVDYIQMIQSYRRAENRTQELSEIARSIKSLAKELDIPIIAVSQLSRAVEALGQKRPMLSHLRESGEIEQVSDLVLFLYREDYYDLERAQKENKENICEVIIAKHRNGPIGTVELFFHKEYTRFNDLERRRSGSTPPSHFA